LSIGILTRNNVKVFGRGQQVGTYPETQIPRSVLKTMRATGHSPHLNHPAETVRLIGDYPAATITMPGHSL